MKIQWHILLFLGALILAGCGSIEEPPPTRVPSETPTPLSTPLPYVPTDIPAGFNVDNPIQLVIVPADSDIASARIGEFESALQTVTDVAISVVLVDTQEEAYDLVCASESGTISAAWLDGMSAITNDLQGCGIGVIQANTPDGTGQTGILLINIEFEEDGLEALTEDEGTAFCRIGVNDLFGWTLPVLAFGNAGISVADITTINEIEDNATLLAELGSGACTIAGISETEYEALLDADEDGTLDDMIAVLETFPEIPYNVFTFSSSLSLDAIADIEAGILALDVVAGRSEPDSEATEEAPSDDVVMDEELMNALFGEGRLQSVDGDFADLFDYMQASGINFAELGN